MKRQHLEPQLATESDHQTVVNLIKEAAGWLQTKGTDQWAVPWPSPEGRDERVLSGLTSAATWLVWDGPTAVASLTMYRQGQAFLWSAEERSEPATYAHRLIVSRPYAGRGLGAELLAWAGKRAHAEYGALYQRIDVWTTNLALHDYYRRLGFRFIRIADDTSGCPSLALFQRPIDSRGALGGGPAHD